MAYVPGFENDVFISYAHVDNEAITINLVGGAEPFRWVSHFNQNLQTFLFQKLGSKAAVWRDPRLKGNELLWPALQSHLKNSAVIVSIVSPRYIKSPSCKVELDFFREAAEQSGGFQADDHVRAFKVVKTPVDRKDHPPIIKSLLAYEFFASDPETDQEREFYLAGAMISHMQKIDDLARDIANELEFLKSKSSPLPASPPPPDNRIRIYVAQTTKDVREQRDRLVREMEAQKYAVLPANSLPTHDDADGFKKSVQEDLVTCSLSVHLIGGSYGTVPDGTDRSVPVLQHDLAVKRAEAGDFFEIICMPPTPVTIEPRQREFIEQLKKHSSANTFEFVEIGVEGLKTHLQDKLKARKPKPPIPPFIYLIFDPSDQAAIQAVRNELQQSSEVRLPARGGEASKVAEDHVECLKDCDGAVIYYGQADEFWFRTKDRDLLKARGWRQKQLKALVVLDAPETRDKKEYENKLYQVCRYFKNSCDCIPPFLEGF